MELTDKTGDKGKRSLIGRGKLLFSKPFGRMDRDFFKNPIVFWLLVLSLLANLVDWGALFFFIKPVDQTIILHYNVYFGVDLVGNWKQAFALPSIGLVILLMNLVLAAFFWDRGERIASHILMIASLMAQLSLLIAASSVVIINY
jgi:hypothetical protein